MPALSSQIEVACCLQEDPELHPPISQLGLDPLLSLPPLEEFRQLMGKQKRQIKAVLLDQVILCLSAMQQRLMHCTLVLHTTSYSSRSLICAQAG